MRASTLRLIFESQEKVECCWVLVVLSERTLREAGSSLAAVVSLSVVPPGSHQHHAIQSIEESGPSGTTGSVPRAYDIFRACEGMKGRENTIKEIEKNRKM
jgi:hypothetical protein